MVQALLALVFAYVWVGALEAIDRFERESPKPEYETAEPEFEAAPSFARTLRIVLFYPFSRTIGRPFVWSVLKILVHAGIVYVAACGFALLFDHVMLGITVVSLLICVVAFFYILISTTRLT